MGLTIPFFFFTKNRPNGVRFTAPIAFDKRLKPMPEDIVGFKHRGFLRYTNKPKFPTLYRLRDDLKWAKDSQLQRESSRKPKGYWDKVENKRAALLEFAKEAGFDPFKAENWRSVTRAQIVSSKVTFSQSSVSLPANMHLLGTLHCEGEEMEGNPCDCVT